MKRTASQSASDSRTANVESSDNVEDAETEHLRTHAASTGSNNNVQPNNEVPPAKKLYSQRNQRTLSSDAAIVVSHEDRKKDHISPRVESTAVGNSNDNTTNAADREHVDTVGNDTFPRYPHQRNNADIIQNFLSSYDPASAARISSRTMDTTLTQPHVPHNFLLSSQPARLDINSYTPQVISGLRRNSLTQLQQQLAMNDTQLSSPLEGLHSNQIDIYPSTSISLDSRLNLDFQIQLHQQRLRELSVIQRMDRNLFTGTSMNTELLRSNAMLDFLPQFSSVSESSLNRHPEPVTASLFGYRASLLENAVNRQERNDLFLTSNNPPQPFARPPNTQRQQQPHPTTTSREAMSNKKAKKRETQIVESNYDPGDLKDLSLPSDSENLSEYQCLLRKQIALFTVTVADIQCSAQGRNKPITLGQVGVLCRHCATIPPGMRPCGAVYFPAKLSGLYQASQNMAINHFIKSCQSIPEPLRSKLIELKERKSTVLGGGKHFWANGARVIGVIECDGQLRFDEKKK